MEDTRPKVLIVDDEPAVAKTCRRVLESLGLDVVVAASASEARAAGGFDLLLADVHLGADDGAALAAELKQARPGSAVIVMTGRPTVDAAVSSMKGGACEFLPKPFSPARLAELARAALSRQQEANELAEERALQLTEAARAKDAFMSRVSHELRTPVSIMMMAADLMRPEAEDEGARKTHAHLTRAVARLDAVVGDLLTHAAGARPQAIKRSVDLWQVARLVAESCGAARERDARLTLLPPSAGLEVAGDPTRLAKAVRHLLLNAVRFGPPGGEIALRGERRGGDCLLVFEDQGPGIPEEGRARVFEAFYQREDHMTREVGGLGLGLAIVDRVAREHGGEVSAGRSPDGGGAFTLKIPARASM